ncbi:MAG: PKD domain-containing protein, partial [Muribaculaceae bacterium]|nr:PKD domain-containing protein [Muribaculaceae bacterium]
VNMPLKAEFKGGESYQTIYRNGFDSLDEANEWNTSSGSNWQLTPEAGGFRDLPPFSSINPDSKYSIYHQYSNTGDVSVMTSPDITLPENATVRFYAAFNPVWIFNGNLQLYVCENAEGAQPLKIWDALLASQEAATDDVKWNRYTADLANYAGKEVYFAFTYSLTDGDNVLIDDFEVIAPETESTTISVETGERVQFHDCSTGWPDAWEWQFPGAVTETSTEQNPVVVYEKPGTYDVTLTVKKGDETATLTREKYVVVHGVAPTAEIGIPEGVYYSPEAGIVVPLNTPLTFTDLSKGNPTRHAWTLPGTDLKSADSKDVTVKYTEAGMFDVDLSVSNDAGTSSTYIYGVKAGGESLAWNIAASENENLGIVQLGYYGSYGGTNWLDMEGFAERFDAPASPVTIGSGNVYFGSVTTVTPDAQIKVTIAKADAEGLPGETLAEASLAAGSLVDASETYNDPTEFVLDKQVKINSEFFVTISGFPNNSNANGEDNIAMYALRRGTNGRNTAYHLLKEMDESYNYTGEIKWYEQGADDACSFAIAPKIEFDNPLSGVTAAEADTDSDAPATYYNLQGIRVDSDNLTPGIYIRRQGTKSTKVHVR